MRKSALTLLLLLVIVFGLLPVAVQAGELDNGLQYKAYKDHVEITGYTGTATEVVIPAQIDGLPTTSVGFEAFRDCKNLTSISIPEGITKFGISAFYGCKSLTAIPIPDSVIEIGDLAFHGCKNLTSISIPNGVTEIGGGVFTDCENLISITIPDSVTEIGNNAFLRCKRLASITIPSGVTKIGNYAFADCEYLTSISIPDGVTRIGDWTFCGCEKMTSVSIPDDLSEIGEYAFYGCENLTEISTLHSVTEIGRSAFYDCKSLTSISVQGDVTEIGYSTFYGCENLTGIIIPDSVTEIGDRAFQGCENLTSISIPNGVTEIGNSAFWGCKKLSSIAIPDGVTEIGESVFSGCKSLTNITIPYGIAEIKDHAFWDCVKLNSIYFKGDAPKFGEEVFWWVIATAYYPSENPTWTDDVMKNYGGRIAWVPYDPNHTHEYKAVVTAPTCDEQGVTSYTCSCGDSYVSDEIPALGHNWKGTSCQRCDAKRENPFNDVADGSFYIDPVLWAVENGITNGATATTFNPNGTCLRAHVVTFLHRAAGNPAPASNQNPFTDVKDGDFFYQPVLWAVEKGITNGTTATTFGSYANCNRAAVVTFLWRAAGEPEPVSTDNPFTDVNETDFFYKPVLWAVENGITAGIDATHFGPTTDCNRAQVVTFLYRAYN